ncbi:MAG: hypothetical protein HQK62_02450 [Desulfamplus sp.]|nr:hypothetical protein [Desulfamplus sp.]
MKPRQKSTHNIAASLLLTLMFVAVCWINTVSTDNDNPVIAIAAGSEHTVALKSDSTVWTWGYGYWESVSTPTQVNISDVSAIACGGYHTVALKKMVLSGLGA